MLAIGRPGNALFFNGRDEKPQRGQVKAHFCSSTVLSIASRN
jgi:hypothetical protein